MMDRKKARATGRKPKHHNRNSEGHGKWKPMPVDEELLMQKDFEHLVSFEVLDHYEILKSPSASANVTANADFKGKKSKTKSDSDSSISSKRRKQMELKESMELVYSPGCSNPWVVTPIGNNYASTSLEENEATDDEVPLLVPIEADQAWNEKTVTPSRQEKRTGSRKNDKISKNRTSSRSNNLAKLEFAISDNILEEMQTWSQLGVPPAILQALKDKQFETPTTIQSLTLPAAIMGKKDIVGAAETGSGKTLAFGIPILSGIIEAKSKNELNSGVKALILTPTRELAVQIKNHIIDIAKYTSVKAVVIVGGLAAQKQERLLSQNPDIIIATPGRLWELAREGNEFLSTLNQLRYLVIDETDRMVERGHFQELEGIIGTVNSDPDAVEKRQNFIFSATLSFTHDPPDRLKRGTKGKAPVKRVTSKQKLRSIMDLVGIKENPKIVDITRKKGTCDKLTEMQLKCPLEDKDYYLYYFFVRHPGRTIVFCNSINCVRRLTNLFFLLKCNPLPLHSDMHQKQRLKSLETFSANEDGVLIATDVAARGLDIVDIQHVIHYQVPRTAESYIHRSGRTARAFKGGLSVLLIGPKEVLLVRHILKSLQRDEDELPEFDVDGEVLLEIKARVNMAVKVEQFEHTVRKKFADVNWIEKARKEMDLASSDEDSDDDEFTQRTSKGKKKNMELAKVELERCKAQLNDMLSINLFVPQRSIDIRNTLKKMAKVSEKVAH